MNEQEKIKKEPIIIKNRLNLDFSLETIEERNSFIKDYIYDFNLTHKNPLTKSELETCADYVLWGKDKDGLNMVQKKELQINTRHKTWTQEKAESLEELFETPGFSETIILYPTEPPFKTVKVVFDRKKELNNAPDYLKKELLSLFKQIDRTELLTNFYEIKIKKRTKPPREELFKLFTEEEIQNLEEKANQLTQFSYLKLRHLLVELRRQQYTIKDLYAPLLQKEVAKLPPRVKPEDTFTFETDTPVFPLGLKSKYYNNEDLIFKDDLVPENFTLSELKKVSNLIWEKKKEKEKVLSKKKRFFDFENEEHLKLIIKFYYELEDMALRGSLQNTTGQLLDTFKFYVKQAKLNPIQETILELKIKKFKNKDIAQIVNEKFQKKYMQNYISTIFYRQVIKRIQIAATNHRIFIENIFFPENFKICSFCGKTLLRTSENFTKRARASDGLSERCKDCDRLKRNGVPIKRIGDK